MTGCYATRSREALSRLPHVADVIPHAEKPGLAGTLEAVRADARRISAAGYREVAVTGVRLGAWGRDLAPRRALPDLLAALDGLPDGLTFRLSALEPMDCSPAVIGWLAAGRGRFAPHLPLPRQRARDAVLAAMRRPHTFADYRRLIDGVRERIPDAGIGTDVMAGFPGETPADAARLERALEELPLSYAHVFASSDRPGTEAATRRPKVPPDEVRACACRLRERAEPLRRRFEARQVGTDRPALTLGYGSIALTDNYLEVRVPPGRSRNERVRVHVVSCAPLQGEVVT